MEAQDKTKLTPMNEQPINNIQVLRGGRVDEEDTIDLLEIGRLLLSRIWILILCLVVGAGVAGAGTKLFITPQYEATSMVYIYSKTTSITSLADLQIGTQLTVDFQIIAKTREVVESVIDELGLNSTYEELVNKINVSNPSGSRILKITVRDPKPARAAAISNALAKELKARVAEVMNTDEPSMVEEAVAPKKPVSPSTTKNAALGGLGLAVLAAAIIIVQYLLDDTIKTEDDVKKYLGLNVLAVIPYVKEADTGESSKGNKRSRKSKK